MLPRLFQPRHNAAQEKPENHAHYQGNAVDGCRKFREYQRSLDAIELSAPTFR